MQSLTTIASKVRSPASLLAGPAVACALLVGIAWAPPVGDAALVALSAALLGGTVLVAREVQRIASMPLEIAPLALGGEVDARPVVRFRARLGLGRPVRDVRATATFDGASGSVTLPVRVPSGVLVGPFTMVVEDPPPGRGTWRIEVTGTAAGRTWTAQASVGATDRRGRFGGIVPEGASVRFEDDWASVVEDTPRSE